MTQQQQQPWTQPIQAPPVPPKRRKRGYVAVGLAAGVLGFALGAAVGGGDTQTVATSQPAPAKTVTVAVPTTSVSTVTVQLPPPPPPPPPPGPKTEFGQGTYLVGTDIAVGRYRTAGPSDSMCYWARLKNDSGELSAIIANNIAQGPTSVTVRKGEFFETKGCRAWTLAP